MAEPKCRNCGAKMDIADTFCINCGVKAGDRSIFDYCAHCGGKVIVGSKFCERCGTPIAKTAKDITVPGNGIDSGSYSSADTGINAENDTSIRTPVSDTFDVNGRTAAAASVITTEDLADDKRNGLKAKFKALPRPAKVAIICGIVALCILIGLGIAFIVHNALSLTPVREDPINENPVEPLPPTVRSVEITESGLPISDKTLEFGESVALLVKIEPEGIDEEVIWTNRNPDIVEIDYVNTNKTIVNITGISQGTTRLTAAVGGREAVCIIRVGEEPPPQAEVVTILYDANPISSSEIFVDDNIVIQISIEPEGVVDEIIFSNNNTDVIEAIPSNSGNTEIMITGKSPGTATLTVTVGDISAVCVFNVKPNMIEVPHPFATALPEFFTGSTLSTIAYLANISGMDEPVVLASRDYASHRVLFINNGNLRTFDFDAFEGSAFTANNHVVGFWPGALDMHLTIYTFAANEINPTPIHLTATFDNDYQEPILFYHNEREITKAVFDAYLDQFGLYRFFYQNESLERPDDTEKILAMTEMVEAPR